MRAAIFQEPRSITAGDRPDAAIAEPTDAVVRVVLACVCGSDLWYYRGDSPFEPGPIGHEFIGVVEETGSEARNVAKGDLVIAPFAFSDGTCPHCRHGVTTACANGGFFPMNGDGGQCEAVRVPLANGTLVAVPGSGHSDEMLRSLLTLSAQSEVWLKPTAIEASVNRPRPMISIRRRPVTSPARAPSNSRPPKVSR